MATRVSSETQIGQKPTRVRYGVIAFAVTLAVVTYIDRVCISQAAPLMTRDLGLTKVQMGLAFSAFGIGYAIYEIPGGYLGDWMGPRRVLTRIVVWWSFFTAATGWAWSAFSLMVIRFLFGAGEAGCFPNVTRAFTTWLPARERVRAQGIMWMSARWGGAFTPLLVLAVLKAVSWQRSFELFGAIGLIWALCFYVWFRDDPREKKGLNTAELELLEGPGRLAKGKIPWAKLARVILIPPAGFLVLAVLFRALGVIPALALVIVGWAAAWYACGKKLKEGCVAQAAQTVGDVGAAQGGHADVPWCKLFRSPTVWLLCLQYACLSYGWYFYITWLPTYLQEARGLNLASSALLATLPLGLGGLGSLFGGFLAGVLEKRIGTVKTRRRMAYVGFSGATALLILSVNLQNPVAAMVAMGMASFSNDLAMPGSWGACMDVGGKYAGTLSGAMNMMGNLGGAISPMAIGYILRETNNDWTITFYVSAAIYLAGAFFWRFLDPVTPLEAEAHAS